MRWADRTGKTEPAYVEILDRTSDMHSTAKNDGDFTSVWYHVGSVSKKFATVDAAAGVSKFWFEVDEGDGTGMRVEDQDGVGFALQDTAMLADSSCMKPDFSPRIDIAVSPF